MSVQYDEVPSTRTEKVGRFGVHPLSGPVPAGSLPARRPEMPLEHRQDALIARVPSETWLLGLGRGIFGGFFLYNGINHFMNGPMLRDYARSKNVPAAGAAVAGTGAMLVLGGLSLLTGTRPRVGASLISAFLLGISPRMHNFWSIDDPQQRTQEMTNFTKNMAPVGAACFAAAIPEPWPLSLRFDRRGSMA